MENALHLTKEFESIVQATSSNIFSLSYRLTGSYNEAHDLFQETYLKAWQKWMLIKDKGKVAPWIRKICINTYIDKYRESKRKHLMLDPVFPNMDYEIVSDVPTPEDEVIANEEVRLIHSQCWNIVAQFLPLLQQVVLILVDIYRLDISETASIIGRSSAATKSLLHRARKTMYEMIAPFCSLLQKDNICRCSSWIQFSSNVEERREYMQRMLREQLSSNTKIESTCQDFIWLLNKLPTHVPPHQWIDEIKKYFE